MTASERLRKIERESRSFDRFDWDLCDLTGEHLLLIADVIEAAESFGGAWEGMTSNDHQRLARLDSSMVALREALEEK